MLELFHAGMFLGGASVGGLWLAFSVIRWGRE